MTDDQFTKLYNYLQVIHDEVKTKASADDMHKVIDAMADIGGQFKDHQEDHDMTDAKLARYDRWFEQIADKIGIKLQA